MENGYITGYIDVAQITLYVFWAFFFALIFWLRKEDRREGYPLESDPAGRIGDPKFSSPSRNSSACATATSSRRQTSSAILARSPPAASPNGRRATGADRQPADRRRRPRRLGRAGRPSRPDLDNRNKIVPSRTDAHYTVASGDPDPRGLTVVGADGRSVGTVSDIWVDRAEHVVRYLELDSATPGIGALLVPMNLAKVSSTGVKVKALLSTQFKDAPRIKSPDSVTFLEEDRICAYFAGGHLYATAARSEPLL